MTASLTTLITSVQALLLDSGTNYTTATCTAAIRQALKEFNDVAPRFAAETLAVVADQHEYELTGGDFDTGVLGVIGVYLNDDDGDDDTPLAFEDWTEDNRSYIRLKEAQTAGENLLVRFTTLNTINGLDSAVESTIPDFFDQVLVNGGALYACTTRAVSRIETINLNKDVPAELRKSAAAWLTDFNDGLRKAGQRKPPPANTDRTWEYNPTEF